MSSSAGYAMSLVMVNVVNVRIGEYIDLSPLIKKRVKPKNSSGAKHLLFCKYSASHNDFGILTREKKTFTRTKRESVNK